MRFGRKKTSSVAPEEPVSRSVSSGDEEPVQPVPGADAPIGPFDRSEVELAADDPSRVDLGSLIVTPRDGLELRLQVDEASGAVAAALLVGGEGAVELRAFASPRGESIWDDVRRSIRAEVARQGGTATEADGPWGTELQVVVTATDPQGKPVTQASRVVGITGPRWLLRATFFGRPAVQPDPDDVLERAVRDVVVVRGSEARAPGDLLPLVLPSGAQRMEP